MTWLEDFKNVFKARTVILALAAFGLGQLAFQFFILRPNRMLAEELEKKLEEMTDTYIQLKATDMTKVVDRLDFEVQFIEKKHETLLSDQLAQEQLPFFISKLERTAEKAGLVVSSEVSRGKEPEKDEIRQAIITLSVAGSYIQVVDFLDELQMMQNMVLIKSFDIQSRNAVEGTINGRVQLLSLISEVES